MGRKKKLGPLDVLVVGSIGALVAASIARELRRPSEERTWQGYVAGVPYDWRPPTVERLRETWWAPDDDRLVKPTSFGVGWHLNLGRVARMASDALADVT